MSLLQRILKRIYDTTGLLPVNAVQGQAGNYMINDVFVTPFLFVITLKPIAVSNTEFVNNKLMSDLKLEAGLESSEHVVIDVHRGFVCIQIPLPAEERGKTVLTSANVPRGAALRVPLGLDILNEPVSFNFADHMSTNLSFLGVPGSGKSVAMRRSIVTLARNNTPDDVKFLMIEVAKNGIDLRIFGQLPHLVHPVITDPDEAAQALKFLVDSISQGVLPYKLFVTVDEVAALIKARPDTIGDLMTLVSQGRSQNVVNLLATQLSDRDTLGEGKAIFKQIHSVVLGKAGNVQLSYVLGNKSGLHADELVGRGDLKLNSVDGANRFAGIFTTRQELEVLPKAPFVNRLPLDAPWKSPKGEGPSGPPPAPPSPSLAKAIAQTKPISPELLCESLISLQRQMDDPTYRQDMCGRAYFILPPKRVKELGRNPELYKLNDQPYLVQVYKALRAKGVRLCLSSKSS
jgi:hypothetical protein